MEKQVVKKAIIFSIILSMVLTSVPQFNVSVKSSESYVCIPSVSSAINETEIVEMIENVDRTEIQRYLEDLVAFGPRWTGTKACDEAAQYIFDAFSQMGLDVEYQPWAFPFRRGKNVIATHHGTNPTSDAVYIICAHYDTTRDSPGANDDASGVAAMLTIANISSQYLLNHTLRFLALSGHECGPAYLYGSTYYAKNAYEQKENIIGVLNLDMIGNTSKQRDAVQVWGQPRSRELLDFVDEVNEKYSAHFEIIIERFNSLPGGNGADEGSFLAYGYDAVMFIQSNFWEMPNHEPGDDLSTIDFVFLTNLTKLVLAVTAELACRPIDIQVRITKPLRGYVYCADTVCSKLPGSLNLMRMGLRGTTFFLGRRVTVSVDIAADEEITNVWFIVDHCFSYERVVTEPPYEFTFGKTDFRSRGKHTIGVQVITHSGRSAFDEIEIFFLR